MNMFTLVEPQHILARGKKILATTTQTETTATSAAHTTTVSFRETIEDVAKLRKFKSMNLILLKLKFMLAYVTKSSIIFAHSYKS
jgi:hypothetical protein